MKVQIKARNRAYQFDATPAQSILYAGLADGIGLPYECGSGTCGTCRAKLVSGEVVDAWPDAPGKRHLRHADEHLLCQCLPQGDCMFELSNFVYAMDADTCTPSFARGVIRASRQLAPDVVGFEVDLDRPCEYGAGQFVTMRVPGIPGFRGYSMVHFERGARTLHFLVKRKPGGGISEWLFTKPIEGSEVEVYGPLGKAVFDPALAKNLLLIGGGSGIAGMLSILERASSDRYFDRHGGYVFFGVRTFGDAFCLDELAAHEREFRGRLSVTVALSDADVPTAARRSYPGLEFARGLVHEVARARMQGKYANARAYVAGPPPAVDATVRMLLLEAKLTTDNIRYDKFS